MVIYRKKVKIIFTIVFFIFLISCGNSEEDTSEEDTSFKNKEEKIEENIINVTNPLETIKIKYKLGKVKKTDIKTIKYKLINNSKEELIISMLRPLVIVLLLPLKMRVNQKNFPKNLMGKLLIWI